jgi:hypothetical protein
MLLGGQVLDGATLPVTAGADGLMVGEHSTDAPDRPKAALH